MIALALTAGAIAQTAASPQLADFAGTWKADFKKQTWLTLTLESNASTLTGTLTHSTYLSSDDEGDITQVGDEMTNDKIMKVDLAGSVLHIQTRDEDGSEDRYNLTLTGPSTADLQPVSTDGAPVPKAFKLKRSVPAPQK